MEKKYGHIFKGLKNSDMISQLNQNSSELKTREVISLTVSTIFS